MKDILILYTNKCDFDKFYLQHMNTDIVDAYPLYNYVSKWTNYIMEIHMLLELPGVSAWFCDWKKKIVQYSTVIIFETLPTECIVRYINKKNPKCRIIYWYWNTVKRPPKNRTIAEYWSFDYKDCVRYNLLFNNQFGFIIGKRREPIDLETDVFFIGLDKNRFDTIKDIEKKLNSFGLKTEFLVVKDKTSNKSKNGYISSMLSYGTVIEKVKRSHCILDLVKDGQTGVTLRFIESAFYGKKIITNNKYVLNHPLYSKERVFILEYDEWDSIRSFFDKEISYPSEEQLFDFTYNGWIKKFFINN